MTPKEKHIFYHSKAWILKRDEILHRDHYECQECRRRDNKANADGIQLHGKDREIRKADTVHHIRYLEDAPSLSLEDDNLESVCTLCHNVLHGREPKQWRVKTKRKLITDELW